MSQKLHPRRRTALALASITSLVMLVLVSLSASSFAQSPQPSTSQWQVLPGKVRDIAINDVAQAYAVAQSGEVLRWRAEDQRWSRMSGNFIRVTGAEGNRPWAVTAEGTVMRYNGLWWEAKETGVLDVGGDATGNIVVARRGEPAQRWEPLSSSWRNLQGNVVAVRIALGSGGRVWTITPAGRIFRLDDAGWRPLPGFAQDIAVGAAGSAYIVDREGRVRVWVDRSGRWQIVPGVSDAVAIAVTPKGRPWVVTRTGTLLATALIKTQDNQPDQSERAPVPNAPPVQAPTASAAPIVAPAIQASPLTAAQTAANQNQAPQASAPQVSANRLGAGDASGSSATGNTSNSTESPAGGGGGSGDPAATTTQDALVFSDTRATAARVEIGRDGSVFALVTGGAIKRWSNERRALDDFPGQLVRLAVDRHGNPWGITALGRVFRHDGQNWQQIAGAVASDIAIGADVVMTSDADGLLSRFNSETRRFERVSGTGIQVAVAPDGTWWTIRSDNVVQRCDSERCSPVRQLARNISIGPDGSIFLVSTRQQLLRKSPKADTFEPVQLPGHTPQDVAVGPKGFPWVVTEQGKLLATRFFDRDESSDQITALRTSAETSGSGATGAVVSSQSSSGFTFTKNMRFDSFKSSDPDANLSNLSDVAVGQDNSVFIHDNSSVFEFNDRIDKFEALKTTFPNSVVDVSTDADGRLWGLALSTPPKVYRINGTQVKTYTVTSETTGKTPRNLAVDGDGTIYAAVGTSIYVKGPDESAFTEDFKDKSVRRVALAGGGDLWILNTSSVVQQWTGSKFESRPKGNAQSAKDIAASADGTVYITNDNKLYRWNATNSEFDQVNATNVTADFDKVALTTEGQPWVIETSSGGMGQGGGSSSNDIFRARK